ncbi:carboxypeptidase-like regulatory domain-containing protein [Bremerella sp. JC770]|uniref:carboxypeptidase-like regulatory domain-containing protein n=1 Tax=Bremerella sp. JC770 TaxID=3232137 RepID=UPI00345AE71B
MNFILNQWQQYVPLLGVLAIAAAGCGQPTYDGIGEVQGTVTLDGQAYPNALITFSPVGGGRPSNGLTDEQGNYQLIYIRTQKGAEAGRHSVKIMTMPAKHEGPGMRPATAPKELLPARYNKRTELNATVEEGPNTIDFALES